MKITKITHDKYNEKCEEKNYSGQTIYVGLDVHKRSWTVAIIVDGIKREHFTQNPDPQLLYRHLHRKYPEGEYRCVYEAGFCGFWILNKLNELGVNCIVVNAADVATKDKERRNKTDRVDAWKLARELSSGNLEAIHILSDESLGARNILRTRTQFVAKLTRCKNQIKSYLSLHGIQTPEGIDERYWSKRYIEYLSSLEFSSAHARTAFGMYLEELRNLRNIILTISREIKKLSREEKYRTDVENLSSIYGISTLSAMIILTELDGIKRFKGLDSLCKYAGLIPSEDSSGESEKKGEITSRKNKRLRQLLVEISWVAIRCDYTLKKLYTKYESRMPKKKAIIKVARHILNRIRYVLMSQQKCKPMEALAA